MFRNSLAESVLFLVCRRNGREHSRALKSAGLFWRNTRTEKHHPDDPPELRPDPSPPPPPSRGTGCTCEFCGCRLTSGGEIIKVGETAKGYRKQEDVIEALKKSVDDLTKERDVLKAAQRAADPPRESRPIGKAY